MMSEVNTRLASKLWLKDRLQCQRSTTSIKKNSNALSPFHRDVLFKWVFDVCYDLKTSLKVSYLACFLIERFLSVKSVPSYEILELLGLVCISISLKFVDGLAIPVRDLETILNKKYSASIIQETEKFVLIQVEWKLEYFSVFDIVQEIVPSDLPNREKIVIAAGSFALFLISDATCSEDEEEVIALAALEFTLKFFKAENDFLQFFEDLALEKERITELSRLITKKVQELRKAEV